MLSGALANSDLWSYGPESLIMVNEMKVNEIERL